MGSLLQVIFFQETFVPSLSVAYKTSDYFFISYQESCYNDKQFINGKQASINKKEGNLRTSNAKIEKEFNDPLKFIYFAMIYKPSTETKQMMQNCMLKLCGISFTFDL